MFAKLKEKIQKEGGAVSEGERTLPALPGHASPRRISTSGSPAQSPLTRDRSTDDLGALSSDDNLKTDASKEDLYAALQRRTEQCRKLETSVQEYAASSKENTKKIEKLESYIEKQQDALAKRTQELNEQFALTRVKMTDKFKEEMEEKEKENQELVNKLKALEVKHQGFYKKEEEKEEIEGYATQELGKLKHMVILKEEELAKSLAELTEKTQSLEAEQQRGRDLVAELTSLQEKLKTSETTRLQLEADSVEHGRIVSALTKERIVLEQSLTETRAQLTESAGSHSALQASYSELENTHQTLVRNYDHQKNKSGQVLQEKEDQIEQLQDRLKLLGQREQDQTLTGDERVTALEKEREGLERKLSETREQLSQVKSSWSEKISHLEEQISHLNGKIVEDNEELAQAKKTADKTRETLEKEITQLKEQLGASEKQAQLNLDLVNSKEAHFNKERLDLETSISQLKLEKIDLDTQLRAKVVTLESQLTTLESVRGQEVAALEQQLDNHKKQIQDLENCKSSLEQRLLDLQSNNDTLQKKVEQLAKFEAGLRSKLSDTEQRLSDAEQRLGEATNQNRQLEQQIAVATGKLSSVQENSRSTASELAESNKDKDQLMLRNAELSQKLTSFQRSSAEERAGLEEELRSKVDAETTLREQCDALQLQIQQLGEQQSEQVSTTDQMDRLQETVTILEEQLADKNKALKKQEQKINDLKKTLHRELKVQSLPNDEPIDPKMAALTPPLARKNSLSRNPHSTDSSRGRRQNSHDRSPGPGDTRQNYGENSNSSQDYFLGQSSYNHGKPGNMQRLALAQDHATISVNDSHNSFHAGNVNYGDSRTHASRDLFETRHLEKDINFQYLKHVVMKFVLSREHESIQLIKAISLLLKFTPDEQKLMKDTLEWKMSWFGGSQPPAVLKGHANKIIPPSY